MTTVDTAAVRANLEVLRQWLDEEPNPQLMHQVLRVDVPQLLDALDEAHAQLAHLQARFSCLTCGNPVGTAGSLRCADCITAGSPHAIIPATSTKEPSR